VKTTRSLTLTEARLRAYSRRGNFHSDPDEARRIGLPGLVAQGMQVAGPAYGVALDAWGDDFLAHGMIDLKFVGMVTEDETVDAAVDLDDEAVVTVTNHDSGAVVVVGSMRRTG
jgi:acyl dehydratase